MARAGLGLGAQQLADLAGVSYPSINRFEKGDTVADDTVQAIRSVLEAEGARFTERAGRLGTSVPAN